MKQKLLQATDHETVIVGRSVGRIRRLLNTPYAEKLLEAEKQGITSDEFAELTSEELHKKGALEGNVERGFMNGGQVSGLISDIPTVQELLDRMVKEAKERLLISVDLI